MIHAYFSRIHFVDVIGTENSQMCRNNSAYIFTFVQPFRPLHRFCTTYIFYVLIF